MQQMEIYTIIIIIMQSKLIIYGPKEEIKNLNSFTIEELYYYTFEYKSYYINFYSEIKNYYLRIWMLNL